MAGPVAAKLINTGWLTLEQVVRIAVSFFVIAAVARHLGPDRFGAYTYLFSLVGLFAPLAMFGLEAIVMRRSVAAPEAGDKTLGTALAIRLGGALVGFSTVVAAVVLFGGPGMVAPQLTVIAALILLFLPGETFNAWFKAQERMALVALPRIAVVLLVAIAALLLVWSDAGLVSFVILRAGEAALLGLSAAIAFAVATRYRIRPSPAPELLVPMLREGWPLLLGALGAVVYMRIDQVMLGWMAAEAELGRYGIAVRIADVALLLPMALQTAFYASLVRAHARAPERFDGHMQRLYDVMALASMAAMVTVGVAATLLLVPVFGAAYAGALPMVLVLLLSLPAIFLGWARNALLTVRGWLWTSPAAAAIGAITNVLLNLLLIPPYGALGAAWATVFSCWIAAYGGGLFLPWLRPAARGMTRSLNPVAAAIRLWRIQRGEKEL